MSLSAEILRKLPDDRVRLVPVRCTSTSPFLVSIAGSTDGTPARKIAGTGTWAINTTGYALWVPGKTPPLCFTTTS